MNKQVAQAREMLTDEQFLAPALDYIRDNFSDDLTLEQVAAVVPISPSYLSHMFRRHYGQTFLEWLTKVRLEAAKRLLEESNLTITDIGLRVGYQDPNYFGSVFKRNTGLTPRDYRRSLTAAATGR